MFLKRRWGLNISQCLRHQQGSGRGPWSNIAQGCSCITLPWEPFWVPFITKGFHEKIRTWEELCSVSEHAPESSACLETAAVASCAGQLLAKPWHRPVMPGTATPSTKCLILACEKALLNEPGHKLFLSSGEQRWFSVWKHEFLIKKIACGEKYFQHTLWRFWWKC